MDKAEFLSELEQLLEVDEGSLQGSESLADIESWDSLAVISFIALVDEKTGVVVEGDALANAKSVEDLFALVHVQAAE